MYMPVCTQTGCTWTENTMSQNFNKIWALTGVFYMLGAVAFILITTFGISISLTWVYKQEDCCSQKVYDASTISQPCFGWGGFQVELTNVCIPKPYPEWRVVIHIHWLIWGQIREKGLTSSFTLRWTWNPLGICAREILTQPWQWAWEDSQGYPGCFSVRCQEDKEGLNLLWSRTKAPCGVCVCKCVCSCWLVQAKPVHQRSERKQF